mmetsp:Transcript_26346/g.60708  ORF Transcript_26346/g.60708 Transcript_26346/m.60708 type:complete len:133 (-) Transcript_26346:127-525(-)
MFRYCLCNKKGFHDRVMGFGLLAPIMLQIPCATFLSFSIVSIEGNVVCSSATYVEVSLSRDVCRWYFPNTPEKLLTNSASSLNNGMSFPSLSDSVERVERKRMAAAAAYKMIAPTKIGAVFVLSVVVALPSN